MLILKLTHWFGRDHDEHEDIDKPLYVNAKSIVGFDSDSRYGWKKGGIGEYEEQAKDELVRVTRLGLPLSDNVSNEEVIETPEQILAMLHYGSHALSEVPLVLCVEIGEDGFPCVVESRTRVTDPVRTKS